MKIDFLVLTQVCYIKVFAFGVNIGKFMFLAGSVPIFTLASIERGLGQDEYFHILQYYTSAKYKICP